ncbi:phage tail tape measure protein [Shinella fusca]|uniref:TP901 family phage tail tape measure protein n=1 Tax=Shinella fusca TaxID=544480 RepID=A0A7W7YR46_9HYPH|nr:phage tail tape measure protein [Shinella fusca]MBB5040694.1 TP901 family phage tail tape measure protein [Shinella fusca]
MVVLKSSLILSLIDNVSGRAGRINKALDGITRQSSSLAGMTSRLAAFGGAYLGVTQGWSRTYSAAADAQAQLSEIGIKAELSQAQLGVMQKRLADMSPRVNQFTSDLRAGVDTMLTMGLGVDQAMGSIEAIGKTSTATGASMTDLSGASVSAMQNLNVLSDQIPRMLDGMTSAGNAGAFEMRDMAQYFPQLTASAKSLGIEGVDGILDMAAALQIARRGAGDASSAANNMSNFLGKIMSPEVMKRFKGFGIDVTKELKKAHKQGISPIEHFIRLVDEKTKGGQADLLGQLFGDKQVLDFVRPMLSDFKDYIRIREDAEKASGTVADAYARRMNDANQKVKSFKVSIENLGESIGANLLGPVSEVADNLSHVFNTLDSRFTIFDELKSRLGGLASGLGLGDGTDVFKSIRDLIFGAEDASAAADKYGRLFGQFQEYGRSIRKFGEDVRDNPIVKFFADLSPYYWEALKWSIGFLAVAGAIRKLASAMMLLSGASTILSAVRGIGGVAAALGLGGGSAAVAGSRGAGASVAGAAAKKGGQFLARWLSGEGISDLVGSGRKSTQLTAFEKIGQLTGRFGSKLGWLGRGAGRLLGTPSMVAEATFRALDAVSHGTMESATRGNPDLLPALDRANAMWRGVAFEGGMHRAGLGAGPQPVTIDASSIAAMTQPSGVQQVQVMNHERPNITVHAPVTISNIASPQDAVEAAASRLGQAAKSALESTFSGGGGF